MARSVSLGFVGLGNIGGPAALNLLREGFRVDGFDVRPNADFAAAGGRQVKSISDLAGCNVILQSLPNVEALRATTDGLRPHLRRGQTIIDLSSYPLEAKVECAALVGEAGAVMLDCEVSGLPQQVAARTAVIFKSGDRAVIDQHQDVFDAITPTHFYLGAFGAANKMKLIANLMVCVHDLMAAEALNLGRAVGIDPALMVEVLGPSAAGSTTFRNKAPLMLSREFENGRGPFRHMFAYLDRAMMLARDAGVAESTPLLAATRATFRTAQMQGRHDQDIAAIIEVLEGMSAVSKGAIGE
ncbi:MAG: NAD(P)-dependent oxidoreductase [Hyphomonadaceae bacterium]